MKFDTKQLAKTAKPEVTRQNQAWAVDFARLDLDLRPFVMLVTDVHTRRPLSATVSLTVPQDIADTLNRTIGRSGRPEEIWIDNGFEYHTTLLTLVEQHGITIIYCPMRQPWLKTISEPVLRDLGAFLCDKSFPSLTELGHDIERWRQRRVAELSPDPPAPAEG
jgi:Integrase core domain